MNRSGCLWFVLLAVAVVCCYLCPVSCNKDFAAKVQEIQEKIKKGDRGFVNNCFESTWLEPNSIVVVDPLGFSDGIINGVTICGRVFGDAVCREIKAYLLGFIVRGLKFIGRASNCDGIIDLFIYLPWEAIIALIGMLYWAIAGFIWGIIKVFFFFLVKFFVLSYFVFSQSAPIPYHLGYIIGIVVGTAIILYLVFRLSNSLVDE